MSLADISIDLIFVLDEKRVDVSLVDVGCTLLAWENQVEVKAKAEPGVERDPDEDEGEVGLSGEEEGGDDPVHEPWGELSWVGGAEGFV